MSTKAPRDQRRRERLNRAEESTGLFRLRLEESPGEISEAAEYIGASRDTIEQWLAGQVSLEDKTIFLQEGFLRKKGIIDPLQLAETPDIVSALSFGLSEKLFSVKDAATAADITEDTVVQYVGGEIDPLGWAKLRLEWLLHNTTVEKNGKPGQSLRPMPALSELQPELARLMIACCERKLTVEVIAEQLNVSSRRVNGWLVWQEGKPTSPMIERIRSEFVPYLTDITDGEPPPAAPTRNEVKETKPSAKKPQTSQASAPVSTAEVPPIPTGVISKPIEETLLELAQTLRCLLLGHAVSLSPSKAIAELEALRVQNPDLWFELKLLVGLVSDPTQFPAWRKSWRDK